MMLDHHKKLKFNKKFEPCAIDLEDELYPNGIFVFNVTKMQLYIDQNRALFPVTQAKVDVHCKFSGNLDYAFIESDAIDLNRPVILAEIAPSMYNLMMGIIESKKPRDWVVNSYPQSKYTQSGTCCS